MNACHPRLYTLCFGTLIYSPELQSSNVPNLILFVNNQTHLSIQYRDYTDNKVFNMNQAHYLVLWGLSSVLNISKLSDFPYLITINLKISNFKLILFVLILKILLRKIPMYYFKL